MIKVIIPQIKLKQGNKDENLELTIDIIKRYSNEKKPTLIVFPELSIVGYFIADAMYEAAEPLNGPTISRIAEVLDEKGNLAVGIGIPELDLKRRGLIYNTYVLISSGKIIGVWRKTHLPTFGVFEEHRYFARNAEHGLVVEFHGMKFGVMICYDAFFPEIARIYSLRGADAIIVPAGSPLPSRELWDPILRARAIENGVYIIFSNHVGYRDGLMFFGESRIIDPTGIIIAKAPAFEEYVLEVEISPSRVEFARRVRPTLRDLDTRIIEVLYKESKPKT